MSASAMEEVKWAEFGDVRLNRRLGKLVSELGRQPNQSIPAATKGRAEMEAAYRFCDNVKVTPEKILAPHRAATLERVTQCSTAILVQDTTELDLTRPNSRVLGAGPMDHDSRRGAFVHPLHAFSDSGIPLGTVWQTSWAREEIDTKSTPQEKKKDRTARPIEDKESHRWVEGLRAAREVAERCPQTTCICVTDSEGDIYELLSEPRGLSNGGQLHLLVRGCQKRSTDQGNWLEEVRATQIQYTDKVQVSPRKAKIEIATSKNKRNKARKARTAKLVIKAKTVTLKPPSRPDRKLPTVTLNVVLVEETDPPPRTEPIQWLLVTSMPIKTKALIKDVVNAYRVRWQIEILFRTLKSGCKVEERHFETLDRILNMVAIYQIIAWRVAYLCYLGRECPDLDCEVVFEPCEWKAVYRVHYPELPAKVPKLNEITTLISSMGGYILRKATDPGVQTMWLGLQRAFDITSAWNAFGPEANQKNL